jgi:hypothetical protein
MDATGWATPVFASRKTDLGKQRGKQSARHASYKGCTDTTYVARSRSHSVRSLAALAVGAVILLGAATSEGAWLRWTNPKYNAALDDSGYVQCGIDQTSPLRDLATVRVYALPITGGPSRVIAGRSVAGREGLDDSIQVDVGAGAHLWMTAVDASGNESCVVEQVYIGPITAVPVEAPAERLTSHRIFDVRGRLVQSVRDRLVHPVAAGIYFWERRYSTGRVESGKMVRVK